MKRSFTLIEVMVSITIFSIIILFLYKTLDMTEKSNTFLANKIDKVISLNSVKKILLEDIIKSENITLSLDKNSNTILSLKTTNIYHNPFYLYVTYFISKEENLIRIESLKLFNKNKLDDKFFKKAYIDILISKIKAFEVKSYKQNNKAYAFMLEQDNETIEFFTGLNLKGMF